MDEGHCGLPTGELTPLAEKLLEVPQDLIRTALDLEPAEGTVIADRLGETDCVFLAGLYRAERAIAERLLALTKGNPPWPSIDPAKAIPWIEQRIGLTLAESQNAAVGTAIASKVLVITGGPGWARPPSSTPSCAFSRRKMSGSCCVHPPAARPST
jgi:exodeoxyribonuclease V alpha subunit